MSFIAAIDISIFVWCENDFNNNKALYFKLVELSPAIFEQVKLNRIPILFRSELCKKIEANFPYANVNEIDYNYGWATLSFLTSNKWITYSEEDYSKTMSNPEIEKIYFNDMLKNECGLQKVHLLQNKASNQKFITYHHFYQSEADLRINNELVSTEIGTLSYKTEKEILDFFNHHKIKFEHHTKHRKEAYYDYDRNEEVSPFSCYHNQGELEAQKLLDEAFPFNNHLYNFDLENNVFVRFIKTRDSIYHGHDLSDEGANIPNEVKKKFHK